MQLGHVPEVHAVDPGDQGRHEDDRGPGRELLHHLVQLVGRLRHPDVHDRGEDLAHAVGELDRAKQMVRDVPEIRDERRRHEIGVVGEPVDHLTRRNRVPTEPHRVSAETEDLDLQRRSRRGLVRVGPEDHALQLVRPVLQLLDHLEVLVHDLVGDAYRAAPVPGASEHTIGHRFFAFPRSKAGANRSVTRNRGEANTKSSDPATPSAPRESGPEHREDVPRVEVELGPLVPRGRRLPRRGRGDPAAAGVSPTFVLLRVDGVDPDPRRPVETLHRAPEIADGNRVGLDRPRSRITWPPSPERNRRGPEPRRYTRPATVAGLALTARPRGPERRGGQMARRRKTTWTHPVLTQVGRRSESRNLTESDRRCDHLVRRLDAVRLPPHRVVRRVDRPSAWRATPSGC